MRLFRRRSQSAVPRDAAYKQQERHQLRAAEPALVIISIGCVADVWVRPLVTVEIMAVADLTAFRIPCERKSPLLPYASNVVALREMSSRVCKIFSVAGPVVATLMPASALHHFMHELIHALPFENAIACMISCTTIIIIACMHHSVQHQRTRCCLYSAGELTR